MDKIEISKKEFDKLPFEEISIVISHHNCDDQYASSFDDIFEFYEDDDKLEAANNIINSGISN